MADWYDRCRDGSVAQMTARKLRDYGVAVVIIGFLACFIVFQVVGRTIGYFTVEPPPHWGTTFFNNQIWMLGHMVGGSLVLMIGPLQFWPAFRNRYLRVHRALGKTYIAASLVSILCLYVRVLPLTYCVPCNPSTYTVTTLWLAGVVAAYLSIRRGDIETHMSFMMRSYVCASYFLLARYFIPLYEKFFKTGYSEDYMLVTTDFLCWILPLVALEGGLFVWRYRNRKERTVTA